MGLSSLPSWIGWLQYFSLFRFTSEVGFNTPHVIDAMAILIRVFYVK